MPKIKMQGQTGKTLESAYEEFHTFKKINNLSKESLMFYGNSFRIFGLFHDTAQPCESVTKETVYKYIEHLQRKGTVNDVTINSYLRGIRVALYYFMELGYMPKFNIKLIRCDKEIKETYTNEELEMLLKKPDVKKVGFAEYRNWVIVNYLLGTGNRLRTLVNLKWADVDFQNDLIRLTTVKNRRQQMIPLSSTLKTILNEYRLYRKGDTDDYVFCSHFGEQLSKGGTETAIQRYNSQRGVTKRSIHLFRHTFAKLWILNGGDIFRLQKILGHSSLDIVKEYVNMFSAGLQQNFDEFNPLENIKVNQKKTSIKMNS
jgi:integrase/recombinase XerD